MRGFLVLCVAAMGGLASGAEGKAPATVDDDTVVTVARVQEGKTTRTVELEPFRPVAYLNEKLSGLPPVNAAVVRTLLSYPRRGEHTYFWPKKKDGVAYDGCTTDVLLGDLQVMRGESKGRTFCCGLTLEVFYRVLGEQPRRPEGLTGAAATGELKRLWFCREINSPGPEDAMTTFGLGQKIANWEEALPGDFVQIWRARKSGHSVIFVAWAHDRQGKRVGLHYWSTQEATDGIGFHTELFGTVDRGVREDVLSITRLLPPEQWHAPGVKAEGVGATQRSGKGASAI